MRLLTIAVVSVMFVGCQCGTPAGNDGGGGGVGGGTGGGAAGGSGGGSGGGAAGGTGGSGGGGGAAGCSPLQLTCSGQCVSPRVDPNNCGGCGVQCDGGTVCSAGLCLGSCQTPLQACAGRCVDPSTDNAHCGACNSPCAAPLGCVGGQCRATVPVGPAPVRCGNGGPPIFVGDGGAADCAGNLAARTFRYALCSCGDLSLSSSLYTDGFDSTHGPYRDAGVGAAVGTNGALSSAGSGVTVGGTLWVAGASGISSSSTVTARQELHCGGRWSSASPQIDGDAWVKGDITVIGSGAVGGTLRLPASATITGTLTTGATIRTPVTVGDACDCSPAARVPVAAIVAAHATNNDNAAIGLDAGVFAGVGAPLRLDLPCGHYFLTGISTSSAVAIVSHGNTALYIDGDISSSSVTITPDPSSQLDVFVAGSVNSSGGLKLGSPNYPAQLRLYVSNGVHFTGASNTFAGNVYVVNDYTASSPGLYYGALAVGSYSNSSTTTIHYDRAVLGQTSLCPTDGGVPGGCQSCRDCNNQACNSGTCGACATSADCCAPLICNGGRCEAAACTAQGGLCATSDTCCTGFWCVTEQGTPCTGTGSCVCDPMFR